MIHIEKNPAIGTHYFIGKSLDPNFYIGYHRRSLCFRILGYQLYLRDVRLHPLLFSQRIGKNKYKRIGHMIITFVKLK